MTKTAFSIRTATEVDIPAVLDLYAGTGLDDGVRMPLEKARALFARFARYPDYRLFVAEDAAGAVCASYALLIMDNIAHIGAPLAVVDA